MTRRRTERALSLAVVALGAGGFYWLHVRSGLEWKPEVLRDHVAALGVFGPLAFVAIMALRPLLVPWALVAIAAAGLTLAGEPLVPAGALGLVMLAPSVVLVVRGTVLAFDLLFRRSHGTTPPSLLDSVVYVLLYGVGAGLIARYWFGVELTPVVCDDVPLRAATGWKPRVLLEDGMRQTLQRLQDGKWASAA